MGGHDLVRRMDRQGEVLIRCRKMLWLCATKNGTKADELLQVGASRHKRIQKDVKTNSVPEEARIKGKDYKRRIQKIVE